MDGRSGFVASKVSNAIYSMMVMDDGYIIDSFMNQMDT
jgi:hypothetical protein